MLAGLICLLLVVQAAPDVAGLCAEAAALMTNSTKEVGETSQRVDTTVSFTGPSGEPVLVIVEDIRDRQSRSTLSDTHRIPVNAIEKIRLHVDAELPDSGPHIYLLIQYQSGGAKDAYAFEGAETPVFGSVKAIRVGLYSRESAEAARGLLDRIRAAVQKPQ